MNEGIGRPAGLRVLHALDFGPRRAPASGAAAPRFSALVLVFVLPQFAQTFYYMNEFPPPYLLSKAWPVLVLPLTIYGWATLEFPLKGLFGILLAYLLGFTPLNSMIRLGNGLADAFITTVKVWPFTYYFAMGTLLVWLRPSPALMQRVVLGLGWFTFGLMLFLWVVVPTGWYNNDGTVGKLFLIEAERGYRIYMPMLFGILLIFYLARRFFMRPQIWIGVAIVAGFLMMLLIYKQRTAIASIVLIVGLAGVWAVGPKLRVLGFAAASLFAVTLLPSLFNLDVGSYQQSLGGSLAVRQVSFQTAIDYLDIDPTKWIFGVGATTRFGSVTLADIFGNSMFFLTDLGWVGVVFEYGLAGAALILTVQVSGYLLSLPQGQARQDPFRYAVSDYILYVIVTTIIYSPVFLPGEFAMMLGLVFYLRFTDQNPMPALPLDRERAAYGTVS